jgi:hypothetical protein
MKKGQFTEVQIIGILKEVEAGQKVGEICRKHGVSEATYYRWKHVYGGAAEATCTEVGQTAVDGLPVEKEDIPGFHQNRLCFHTVRQGHSHINETQARIRGHCTEQRPDVTTGDSLQAAVLLVAIVHRHPGCHTGPRLHAQIVLVLVQRLSACASLFELEHCLHGVGFCA